MKLAKIIIAAVAIIACCSFLNYTDIENRDYIILEKEGYSLVVQPHGPTLGYSPDSGVGIITVDGLAFKDLSRNGKLEPFEDWRLTAAERARDLATRLSIEEIAGLMLYSGHQPVPQTAGNVYGGKSFKDSGAEPWELTDVQRAFLEKDNVRAVLVTKVESPATAARWTGICRRTGAWHSCQQQ